MLAKDKKILFRLVVDIYIDFYRQVSLNADYKFSCSDRDATMINNFIDRLNKDVGLALGKNYLIDYFEHAFNYWYSLDTKFGKGNVMLNWVIGQAAYERWSSRHKHSFKYFVRCGLKKDIAVKRKRETTLNKVVLQTNIAEEELKAKFHNSMKGFVFCVGNTTMYNHKSALCGTCKNITKCKEVLKQEYPKVFKIRGYER